MDVFDSLIDQVRELSHDPSFTFGSLDAADIGFAFGPHTGRGVVLQKDTALELGAGGHSCGMILPTSDTSRAHDGRISVYGACAKSLMESAEGGEPAQAPFGQVIIAAGADLSVADLSTLEDCLYTKDYVNGYFVRSSEGRIHSRVSRRLSEAGFEFDGLGSALIRMVKEARPSVEAVEVIFATETGEAFDRLSTLRGEWLSLTHDTRKGVWLEKGLDIDCPAGGHCGQCADRDLCNNVREIAKIRRKGR